MAQILWGSQFKRGSAQPLTADESFGTYADLTAYLSDALCYSGQVVSVTSDSDSKKNGVYWISGSAGSFAAMKLTTSIDVADSTSSVFVWKGNVTSSTLVKSGTGVKPGYAYRWNETATSAASNTLAAANSASGSAEVLERGDLLICADVTGNVPKYSVVQNNIDTSDIDARISDLNDSIGAVGVRVTTAEGDIQTLQGEMDTVKGDVSGLKSGMDTAEGDIVKLQGDLSTLSGSHDVLAGQYSALSGQVSDVVTKMIPGIEKEISDQGDKITGLENKFDANGAANSANQLKTGRKIDGVVFNGNGDIAHYAVCQTAAATVEKAASLTNFALVSGARAEVMFTAGNTAVNPKLNINSTGAKDIYYQGRAIPGDKIEANTVYSLVYNGSVYVVVGKLGDDTPTVSFTDYESGETTMSTEQDGDVMLDVLVPCVGISTNTTLQDIKAIDESKVAEVEWVSHAGGVHSYDCALQLGGSKRVLIATANTQEVVDLTIAGGKHYGFIVDGANGAFGCSLICFDGTTLKVLKTDGATDEIMDALTNEGGADHDMFVFLPVGTKFLSTDGLTEYTKKDNTTVYKERFVL